jgi:predicted nucleotidyltransferase
MIDLKPYRDEIVAVCRELGLKSLDVVGSATRSDFSNDSDVDVLVSFEGSDRLFVRYFRLKEKLEVILKRPVDVIEERALRNPFLVRSFERDRVRIYGA